MAGKDGVEAKVGALLKKVDAFLKLPKVPKDLGAAVDGLAALRDARRAIAARAEKAKENETAFETAIFEAFDKSKLEGARGKTAQATIKRSEVPTLETPDEFFAYLRKHPEDIDLLQRRLSTEAARERWAAGVAIPGVGKFTKVSLSLTKVKGANL